MNVFLMKINRFNIFMHLIFVLIFHISKTIFNEFCILRLINNFFLYVLFFLGCSTTLLVFQKQVKIHSYSTEKLRVFNAFLATFNLIYRIGIFLFLNLFLKLSNLVSIVALLQHFLINFNFFLILFESKLRIRNKTTRVHFTKRLHLRIRNKRIIM